MYANAWNAAWNQTTPVKDARRIAMAPNGKNITKASPASVAWAVTIFLVLLALPPELMGVKPLFEESISSQYLSS